MRLWSKVGLQPRWGLCPQGQSQSSITRALSGRTRPVFFWGQSDADAVPSGALGADTAPASCPPRPGGSLLGALVVTGLQEPAGLTGPFLSTLLSTCAFSSVKQPMVLPPPQVLEGIDTFQLLASLLTPGNSSLHVSH